MIEGVRERRKGWRIWNGGKGVMTLQEIFGIGEGRLERGGGLKR